MPRGLIKLVALVTLSYVVSAASPAMAGSVPDVRVETQRIAGADRYGTAVAIARAAFPGWSGVRSVIVASGEDGTLADALAASTLTKAAAGPLVLVQRDRVPDTVAAALREIGSTEGALSVFIVGGTGAVSEQCASQVAALLGDEATVTRVAGRDRYATAASVASVLASMATGSPEGWPGLVLLVNGEPRFGLVDALGASAAGAAAQAPVLYVQKDAVPDATRSALASLNPSKIVVIGGSGVVSDVVLGAAGAEERWYGVDRYATAYAIANNLWKRGLVARDRAVVARTVADAVASAQLAAAGGGPVALVSESGVPKHTAICLGSGEPAVARAFVIGGFAAVPASVERELRGAPHPPVIASPRSGALCGGKAAVTVRTGANARQVRLYRGDTLIATRAATPFSEVAFGLQAMPKEGVALRAVAVASDRTVAESAARYRRLAYPASTSIVIDKSDFRLYWVKDDVLINAYPIAIGKPRTPTPAAMWRIGAKYLTDPAGIYGPRKMRLFRRVVNGDTVRYVYTRYNIHGTNQPWVIGTMASHGCIRMYNRDVLELYPQVPLGTLVQTRE